MDKKNDQNIPKKINALVVRQWLPEWNNIKFDDAAKQKEPQHHFFMCSIKAGDLKALTGVYRRSTKDGKARAKDPNVQRGHEQGRSDTIREYVKYGYPWCDMTDSRRRSVDADDLQKPGWLPGAILVNILAPGTQRNGVQIANEDLVTVSEKDGLVQLSLPENFTGSNWEPTSLFPLEVIDGQHRLWAFDGFDPGDDFDLPVVAFLGLDTSWQAYLFWSVNITPKRINKSLAFDLYPLLRKEEWLDKNEGHSIYRETRCQELVEALWLNEKSPWYHRINMLGESKSQRDNPISMVTQAAWIRSLMATLVKPWEGRGTKIGGLFGAPIGQHEIFLPWNRPMQAAFLIYAGMMLRDKVMASKAPWAEDLRTKKQANLFKNDETVFYGDYSLLTTDQGIRGFLYILNDFSFILADKLNFMDWTWESVDTFIPKNQPATEEEALKAAITSLADNKISEFLSQIAEGLSTYDWRTSSTPGLDEETRLKQSVFRGSSGYKELRRQLCTHFSEMNGDLGSAAKTVLSVIVKSS